MSTSNAPPDSSTEHIINPSVLNHRDSPNDLTTSTTSTRQKITINDLKKLLQKDHNCCEVTVEQIQRVKLMHDNFLDGASFSFNYNTLLVVASVIAGLGLVSDSSATVIASMLVSPIMGPVVALAYGTTILDRKMVRLAMRNELLSLLFCVLVGVVIGACTGLTELAQDWPTNEMASRCSLQNLYVGIPTAFFSGLGVAVSLLDDQTNSLVGVAISASLLPPAVNCGIVFIAWYFVDEDRVRDKISDSGDTQALWAKAAWVSLGLTLVNILMIWLSSMVMFRLKEVLPIEKKIFWSDLGIARKIYQGKAILAQKAFGPEVSEREVPAEGAVKRSMWGVVRNNLRNIRESESEETGHGEVKRSRWSLVRNKLHNIREAEDDQESGP